MSAWLILLWLILGLPALLCVVAAAILFPLAATGLWVLVLEATPDMWRAGDHEGLIGMMKGAGVLLVAVLGLRFGWRKDRFNPGFAFAAMFLAGLAHGLYPGLTLLSSLRSMVGSAGPFAFGFARTGARFRQLVSWAAMAGPLVNVAVGAVLNALHIHALYVVQGGAFRLAGAGEPAFLGGFALVAIYAGLLEMLRREDEGEPAWPALGLLALNGTILLLSGARSPLLLAAALVLVTLLLRRRLLALAGLGALAACAVLFASEFGFLRVISLLQKGQAENLSNRNLIWPDFEAAIATSPWFGWGVGAGKQIVPTSTGIATLLGTNAAHNEYLRIASEGGYLGLGLLLLCIGVWTYLGSRPLPRAECWFMRLVLAAFAVHSATDNTLIATTSSVLFIWASAVFSAAAMPVQEVA